MIGIRMSRMMASGRTLSASSSPASAIEGGRDFETLELEHPRERIGHRAVVVHDQDGLRGGLGEGALGRSDHRIILKAKGMGVKAAEGWVRYAFEDR